MTHIKNIIFSSIIFITSVLSNSYLQQIPIPLMSNHAHIEVPIETKIGNHGTVLSPEAVNQGKIYVGGIHFH